MTGRLVNQVAIITGGGTGIGLGIAQCCAREGAAVVLAQRPADIAIAQQAAETLCEAGYQAVGLGCDITERHQVQALIAEVVAKFGALNSMVNNAALTGSALKLGPFLEETDDHWQRVLQVNLHGAFICTQEAARQMVAQGSGGSIINISSVAQFAAQEHAASYCASKAGLDGLTKAAAIELAPHNIRVNNVAPGAIYTEANARVVSSAAEHGATGHFFRFTPLGRPGTPHEIGNVVAFLASSEASFVTGATWLVDGGFLAY